MQGSRQTSPTFKGPAGDDLTDTVVGMPALPSLSLGSPPGPWTLVLPPLVLPPSKSPASDAEFPHLVK